VLGTGRGLLLSWSHQSRGRYACVGSLRCTCPSSLALQPIDGRRQHSPIGTTELASLRQIRTAHEGRCPGGSVPSSERTATCTRPGRFLCIWGRIRIVLASEKPVVISQSSPDLTSWLSKAISVARTALAQSSGE